MTADLENPAPAEASIWIDVTTLAHWNRPAVGIIRVEQQLCKWLIEQHIPVRFCGYDRRIPQLYEISRAEVIEHLRRIDGDTATASGAIARNLLPLEERLRLRVLDGLVRVPWRPRAMILNGLVRAKPRLLRLIGLARTLRNRLRLRGAVPAVVKPTTPVQLPRGSVYVSLGLDWDYKDMAHLYRLKQQDGLKCLFFCYDVIPILFPHLCVGDVSRQFAHYFTDLAWGADRILSISESSRRDLNAVLTRLGVPRPDNHVVHLGSNILPRADANLSPQVGALLDKPYLLFVSTIERRKNHEILYRAYARLAECQVDLPQLVFVGMPGWGTQELLSDIQLDPRVQGKIRILNHVSDGELAALYRNALFTVFPSLYEGWGLPVAESLAFGKFCLCSNTSSLPEVGGDWVEYLDPWDLPAWVDRLHHHITHPAEVERRNREIAASYRPNTWREAAETIYRHATQLLPTGDQTPHADRPQTCSVPCD